MGFAPVQKYEGFGTAWTLPKTPDLGHCNKNGCFWNNRNPVRRAAWPDLQPPPPGSGAGAERPLGIRCLGVMVYRSNGDVDLANHLHGPGSGSGRHPRCPAPTLEPAGYGRSVTSPGWHRDAMNQVSPLGTWLGSGGSRAGVVYNAATGNRNIAPIPHRRWRRWQRTVFVPRSCG